MEILVAHKIRSRLQEWIEEAGLNYSTTSAESEVSLDTVRRYAKNQFDRVDCESWQKICRYFKKPLSELFYEESDRDA